MNLIISLVPSQWAQRQTVCAWAFYKKVISWNDDTLTEISQVALFRTRIFSPPPVFHWVVLMVHISRHPGLHCQPTGHPSSPKLSLVSLSVYMQMIWHYFNHFSAYPVSSFKIIHSFNICNLCSWEHIHEQTKSKQILMEFIPLFYIHVTVHRNRFLFNNQLDAIIIQIYFVVKLCMFWASSLPIIRSFLLYIWHWW